MCPPVIFIHSILGNHVFGAHVRHILKPTLIAQPQRPTIHLSSGELTTSLLAIQLTMSLEAMHSSLTLVGLTSRHNLKPTPPIAQRPTIQPTSGELTTSLSAIQLTTSLSAIQLTTSLEAVQPSLTLVGLTSRGGFINFNADRNPFCLLPCTCVGHIRFGRHLTPYTSSSIHPVPPDLFDRNLLHLPAG